MQLNQPLIIIMIVCSIIGLVAAYLTIKDNQDVKNKIKQKAKERAVMDELFKEAPTCFLQNGYESFEDTPMMER